MKCKSCQRGRANIKRAGRAIAGGDMRGAKKALGATVKRVQQKATRVTKRVGGIIQRRGRR